MNKAWLVAQREFLENIRTKSFWIGIFLFPVLLTLMVVVPELLERVKGSRGYTVVDRSGWLLEAVQREVLAGDLVELLWLAARRYREGGAQLAELPEPLRQVAPAAAALNPIELPPAARFVIDAAAPGTGLPDTVVSALRDAAPALLSWWNGVTPAAARRLSAQLARARYVFTPADTAAPNVEAQLDRAVGRGELFAYFVIGPEPVADNTGSKYVSKNLTDEDLREWFGGLASAVVRQQRLDQEGIARATAQWIQAPLAFEERRVTAAGEQAEVERADTMRQWAPVVFVYLLWISVFTIAQMLLTNTIEEKSNRLMEVLLSSVSPVQLMAGKIGGIAITGLTVVASWVVFFVAGVKLLPRLMNAPARMDFSALLGEPIYLASFVAYFLLGYLLYAALLVGIGSVCNTLKEAQNLMTPVILLLMVPLFSMVPIGRDPNGTLAQVLSYVPPFTPFVMMNRAAGPPTLLEYLATTGVLLVSIAAALWAAAKVFRVGVLLYGKPPTPREILRWIRAPVGVVAVRRESPT